MSTRSERNKRKNELKPGEKWGIWNSITKRFVFGIKADSIAEANDKLYKEIGKGAYCWRYEVKKIPAGFKNPKNKLYK